jgi:hypothetical protein
MAFVDLTGIAQTDASSTGDPTVILPVGGIAQTDMNSLGSPSVILPLMGIAPTDMAARERLMPGTVPTVTGDITPVGGFQP